jgi:hypothetical protein
MIHTFGGEVCAITYNFAPLYRVHLKTTDDEEESGSVNIDDTSGSSYRFVQHVCCASCTP